MFYNSSYGDILVVVHSSKRKNVKISLKHNLENGEIEIHLHGPKLKESGAGIYLDRFKDWLDKKIEKFYNSFDIDTYKNIIDLKIFYLYGKCYNVIFTDSINRHLLIEDDNLYYYKGLNTNIDYKRFSLNVRSNYTNIAKEIFDKYNKIFGKNTELRFRNLETSYGYLEPTKNKITLSYRLVSLPLELIDYIVIHEFCHYKHLNHQKEFYDEVEKYCKDYKNRISLLKKYYPISR